MKKPCTSVREFEELESRLKSDELEQRKLVINVNLLLRVWLNKIKGCKIPIKGNVINVVAFFYFTHIVSI